MWFGLLDFKEQIESWKAQPFGELNTEAMQVTISKYVKLVNQCNKGLPTNTVLPLLADKVTTFKGKAFCALITVDVHNRNIVTTMIEEKVESANSFTCQMQLRFYWDVDIDDCVVRQVNARILYGFEYQGCLSRLVITPLTDRCWLTIAGGLHVKLGSAPAGPAGTGKTESTKDLLSEMLDLLSEMLECGKGVFEVRRRLVLEPTAHHDAAPDYL